MFRLHCLFVIPLFTGFTTHICPFIYCYSPFSKIFLDVIKKKNLNACSQNSSTPFIFVFFATPVLTSVVNDYVMQLRHHSNEWIANYFFESILLVH